MRITIQGSTRSADRTVERPADNQGRIALGRTICQIKGITEPRKGRR